MNPPLTIPTFKAGPWFLSLVIFILDLFVFQRRFTPGPYADRADGATFDPLVFNSIRLVPPNPMLPKHED